MASAHLLLSLIFWLGFVPSDWAWFVFRQVITVTKEDTGKEHTLCPYCYSERLSTL